ncbi:MAG: DUF1178 family protein [Sphingomonadaceae bacterium]
MIVYDLACSRDHRFEAWFESSAAYDEQRARGLVTCPLCDCAEVGKAAMAPAIAARRGDEEARQRLAALRAEVEANFDYVGDRFAEVARERHAAGDRRGAYGETTLATAIELIEEGVPVAPLPFRPRRLADA